MVIRPNPSSGVPIYLQVMEQVKIALESGAIRPGEPLPGVGSLAEQLVINPAAVARAYRELEHEGLISQPDSAGVRRACAGQVAGRSVAGSYTRSPRELAIENSRLAAQVAAESADRVKRNRELALAEEVQQRLFPQTCPSIPGLDYAGTCRPALGVGGDYYDFLALSETRLGIAIGDVSGKGIAAALLMATLRAYVHGQTLRGGVDLPEVIADLNRLVFESSAANRYATFFYAQYDAPTRTLDYVNAGHNPPLLSRIRGGRHEIVRLETGGPVIGLIPDCVYRQGAVSLAEDDVLLLFTDGIIEAMNAAGDEWGEERLTETLAANRARAASDLIAQILHASDDFVGRAEQYDDMTLIAARVTTRSDGRP